MRAVLRRTWAVLPYVAAAGAVAFYVRDVTGEMITARPDIVDFSVYFAAARDVAAGHSIYPAYSGCCFDGAAMNGYTYPPVLAVALWPLTGLPVGVAGRIFLGISQLCLVGALVLMSRTVAGMVPRRVQAWLLVAVLLFQPIHAGNFGIQVTGILMLLFALAAHAHVLRRSSLLAGVAVGLGAAIKVAPAQMMAALLTDRRDRGLRAMLGFAAAVTVPLLLVWPIVAETPGYFVHVLPRFAGGVDIPYNRSLAGVVLRTYTAAGRTPPDALADVFHVIQLAGVAGTWLVCRRSAGTAAGRAATFAAFLAVMPITQTVTWDHHQATDALAFVLLAPSLAAFRPRWWAAVAGMGLMCVNQLSLAIMLRDAGYDPPHGAGIVVFVAGASVNLAGMALLYGAALNAAWAHREWAPRQVAAPVERAVMGRTRVQPGI